MKRFPGIPCNSAAAISHALPSGCNFARTRRACLRPSQFPVGERRRVLRRPSPHHRARALIVAIVVSGLTLRVRRSGSKRVLAAFIGVGMAIAAVKFSVFLASEVHPDCRHTKRQLSQVHPPRDSWRTLLQTFRPRFS